MRIEILSIFWGDEYFDMLTKTCAPSLACAIGQMRADGHEVIHRALCTIGERDRLKHKINRGDSGITWDTSMEFSSYMAMAKAYREAISREVLTIVAAPDLIFGHGLWESVMSLKRGEMMVCGQPRVDMRKAMVSLQDMCFQDAFDDNRIMVELCMDYCAHPMVEFGKNGTDPYWRTTRREDHWETYFSEPPPLAFWGCPEMLDVWKTRIYGEFEVIDHDLVNWCHKNNRLRYIVDSRDFFWAELTPAGKYGQGIKRSHELPSMRFFDQVPLRWYF